MPHIRLRPRPVPVRPETNPYEFRARGPHDPNRGWARLGFVHDENYKKLFAFPRMVEDLLRALVTGDWLDEADFSTLRKLSAEYVSDELRRRYGDTVWQVRLGDGWLHVLVLLEFRSRDDPDMALRMGIISKVTPNPSAMGYLLIDLPRASGWDGR